MERSFEPALFDHGILTEASDIRAHVGVLARRVFVFKTAHGIEAIEKHNPPIRSAGQDGVVGKTAEGYAVSLESVEDIRTITIPNWPVWDGWDDRLSTSERGRRAVEVVCHLLKRGIFPLWIDAFDDDRKLVQLSGTDIVVFARKRIQVKCDFRAGRKEHHWRCTGNLFLQTKERNPLKRI